MLHVEESGWGVGVGDFLQVFVRNFVGKLSDIGTALRYRNSLNIGTALRYRDSSRTQDVPLVYGVCLIYSVCVLSMGCSSSL